MSARNPLLAAPPHPVEECLKSLGRNLRVARVRRRLTMDEVAEKLGIGRRVLADAERGKPSTGIAVYLGLLWTYGLLEQLTGVADPALDVDGQTLALASEPTQARRKRSLDGRSPVRPQ